MPETDGRITTATAVLSQWHPVEEAQRLWTSEGNSPGLRTHMHTYGHAHIYTALQSQTPTKLYPHGAAGRVRRAPQMAAYHTGTPHLPFP